MATLRRELYAAVDACLRCGSRDHFVATCPQRVPAARAPTRKARAMSCARCGRASHTAADCYATTDVQGMTIGDSDSDGDSDGDSDSDCRRCGRTGHSHTSCYASTNVNGKKL
jgi:ribosomal protein L37E